MRIKGVFPGSISVLIRVGYCNFLHIYRGRVVREKEDGLHVEVVGDGRDGGDDGG